MKGLHFYCGDEVCRSVKWIFILDFYGFPCYPGVGKDLVYLIYIAETRRRLGDCFRGHLWHVETNDKDASKQVARHFNLPNHYNQNMTICGLSLHQGYMDSRKNLEQKFIFQTSTLNPHGINERLSFN